MNSNKVNNPMVKVPNTSALNDRDYMNAILEYEKNMSNNLSIALSEASNEYLYNEIMPMFNSVKKASRDLYYMMFEKGWYSLEKAEEQKITQKQNELQNKMSELIM